jgi:hypothetical protein
MRALAFDGGAGDGNLLLDASSGDLRCTGWGETTTPMKRGPRDDIASYRLEALVEHAHCS